MFTDFDTAMMREALALARQAAGEGEVPVGAVVVREGQIVGRGFNLRETQQDPTAHAEILAIRSAAATLGSWRLDDCTLYATLEPCPMCAGAIVNARIPRLVFGPTDPKMGSVATLHQLCTDPRFNHRLIVEGGLLADEGAELLRAFFRERRKLATDEHR